MAQLPRRISAPHLEVLKSKDGPTPHDPKKIFYYQDQVEHYQTLTEHIQDEYGLACLKLFYQKMNSVRLISFYEQVIIVKPNF